MLLLEKQRGEKVRELSDRKRCKTHQNLQLCHNWKKFKKHLQNIKFWQTQKLERWVFIKVWKENFNRTFL